MPLPLVADEERAQRNWDRLKETLPDLPWASLPKEGRLLLDLILGFSPYATNLLVQKEEILKLFWESPFPHPRGPRALKRELLEKGLPLADWRDFALFLRALKQREIVKILARDLAGEKFSRTVMALSGLAEALLEAALAWLLEHQFKEISPQEVIVLGLGKLGGRELNYSSDIDLIYLFHGPLEKKERYLALFRELSRLFDSLVDGDRLFRVDLRLRPGGKEGELAFSLKAARNYYFFQSHPFERLALLKAKTVAGNRFLGKAFLCLLRPVIYPRFLDYAYLEHIRDLKERIRKEALKVDAQREIKIGPGGLREIEFFCQTLQMIYGGKYPFLRVRHTLWSLDRLQKAGLLPPEEARALREAYIFLRLVEHRLQTPYFRQTATLPQEAQALKTLARSLGFEEVESFFSALERHRQKVAETFAALLEPQRERGLSEGIEAFLEGSQSLQDLAQELDLPTNLLLDLRRLLEERGPLGKKRAPLMRRIVREILGFLPQIHPKEKALARLISFFERLGGRLSFYHALAHHPERIRDLLELFAKSAFLTHLLTEAPAAAEGLFQTKEKRPLSLLLAGLSTEEALSVLRSHRNEEILRWGLLDLKGKLPLPALLEGLSSLAWEIINHTFTLALSSFEETAGAFSGQMSLFGLGKLGSRELGYRSDLDLIFVARAEGYELVKATKIAQRLLHYLSVPLPEGPGYQVDTRLRPEGRKGPLVVSLEGFLNYHREQSGLWEKLALVRLAWVAGHQGLGEETLAAIKEILRGISLGKEAASEIKKMRSRMEKERGKPGFINLKVGPGGLADLEFISQWLSLKALQKEGLWPAGPYLKTLDQLQEIGLLPPEDRKILEKNYLFLRTLDQKLVLLLDKAGEEKLYLPEELENASPYLGAGVYNRYLEICHENRELFEKWLV